MGLVVSKGVCKKAHEGCEVELSRLSGDGVKMVEGAAV